MMMMMMMMMGDCVRVQFPVPDFYLDKWPATGQLSNYLRG